MTDDRAWLLQTGMATAVGDSAVQTGTSVRAGINRYKTSTKYNWRSKPMTLAWLLDDHLPPLTDEVKAMGPISDRQSRMLRLADVALAEIKPSLPKQPVPLLLAGPEPFPSDRSPISGIFLHALMKQTGITFDLTESRSLPQGRAAGIGAIHIGLQLLASGKHDAVLVGGVDSYNDFFLLDRLDKEGRVLAEGVMDGFCPGEGAGFLLLCSERARAAHGLKPIAKVHKPGLAIEPGHRYSKEPYRGDGLADAVRSALEVGLPPIETVLCTLNGEHFGVKEWGVALIRNRPDFAEDYKLFHPADSFGDIGAAFGPVLVGLAAIGMNKAYRKSPSLVWCSSERGQRGAVCVTPAPGSVRRRLG